MIFYFKRILKTILLLDFLLTGILGFYHQILKKFLNSLSFLAFCQVMMKTEFLVVQKGQSCTLVAQINSTLSDYKVNWFFKNSLIASNGLGVVKNRKYFLSSSGNLLMLTIPQLQSQDFGEYSVAFSKAASSINLSAVINELKINCKLNFKLENFNLVKILYLIFQDTLPYCKNTSTVVVIQALLFFGLLFLWFSFYLILASIHKQDSNYLNFIFKQIYFIFTYIDLYYRPVQYWLCTHNECSYNWFLFG